MVLNGGIIGLGKMGISHCSIVNAHPNVNLVGVCDTNNLVLEAFKKYSSVKTYSDYKRMIDENDQLNFIFIATPTKYHADILYYALEKKINVFCEKPFTLEIADGKKIAELVKEKSLINQVGYHNRYLATFNYLRDLVISGILGDIYHFVGESYGPVVVKKKAGSWRSKSNEGGGCLYDYASHVINLVEYILSDIEKVNGTFLKKIYSKDVEDAVYSGLTLKNGLNGYLSVNWSDETFRKMSTQISIFGTNGKAIADAQEIKIYLKEDNEEFDLEKGWNIKYITDIEKGVDFYLRGEEYSSQIDYFINALKDNRLENRNSFYSALKTDKIINLILNSAKII